VQQPHVTHSRGLLSLIESADIRNVDV